MIIDAHGHYTTAPPAHGRFREAQLAALADPSTGTPAPESISDDEIRESLQRNQVRVMDARDQDLVLLSPQASSMQHHVPDRATATAWARASNDLVGRATSLFPERFASVCQLPQTPDGDLGDVVAELRRCVETMGFVGANLNPDPSGGHWTAPPLTDESWFPLYDTMVELDVPAMVHVSASCNPAFHTLGAHYLNADTTAFVQLLQGDLFARFPTLRFVIPHGGGAVPYHWGRFRGLSERNGWQPPEALLGNVVFDTCVYHQPGIDLLHEVVGAEHLLFASEMLGAVRGADPATGIEWDDTKRYVDALGLDDGERSVLFEANVRRVYPRLDAQLTAAGR